MWYPRMFRSGKTGDASNSESDSMEDASSGISGMFQDHGGASMSVDIDAASSSLRTPRSFVLPMHYEPSYGYPLIVWLHDDGHNEHQLEQVMPHISLRNFVGVGIRGVRAADSVGHRFDWPQKQASIHAAWRRIDGVIEEAKQRFSVHDQRIILAGYGSGATMALRIALRQPNQFGGVVALGGRLPQQGRLFGDLNALRERKLPLLWQWATRGGRFSSEALTSDLKALMATRCQVEVRQYTDAEEMNTVTLADINDWIMRTVVSGSVGHSESPAEPRVTRAPFSTN
ncbi:MAG: alpha/beta hydrolase-fold protein [Planctomycetota bacterium]